jgi:hypothetical protein
MEGTATLRRKWANRIESREPVVTSGDYGTGKLRANIFDGITLQIWRRERDSNPRSVFVVSSVNVVARYEKKGLRHCKLVPPVATLIECPRPLFGLLWA